MYKQFSSYLVIFSAISHLFCCFLPGVLSVVTLIASSGSAIVTLDDLGLPEKYHADIITFSFVMLVVSGVMNYISWRIDCRKDGHCVHEPCKPKKKGYLKLYFASVIFFLINVAIHFGTHLGHSH